MKLRSANVIRYIMPLREGGSLPALAEADDGYKYVLKFKGGGHGSKALVSELIGGEVARKLGLRVPELVFLDLDEAFGRTEGDEEIQDLLQASRGLNLGLHFLSGALTYDPVVTTVDLKLSSQIVWLDAFLTNVDRTTRNTNMLIWHKELWLIDQGASLYFHHSWENWEKYAVTPFTQIKDHVLLRNASLLNEVDIEFKEILSDKIIRDIIDLLPQSWLNWGGDKESFEDIKNIYFQFLIERRNNSNIFIKKHKMQEKHLYEYAVIRILPRVDREEFINVGIILFSKRAKFIKTCYHINFDKLKLFSTELDLNSISDSLVAFDKICSGHNDGGYIATFDIPERFRWLTAVRSSSIQTSRPHPGFSTNLDETLGELFTDLVL